MSRTTNTYTDGVSVIDDATYTSATANFTTADEDKLFYGDNIPANTIIDSRTNSTTVELSKPVTASGSGLTFTIGSSLPMEAVGGKLPLNFEPTPTELYEAIVPRLKFLLSSDNVILGSLSTDEPLSNVGPWFTNYFWRLWDATSMEYVAQLNLAYGAYTLTGTGTPTENRTQYFPNRSGTVALLLDTYVPRETTLLTIAATTDLDCTATDTFLGRLSEDTTITITGMVDGQKIKVALINNGTDYTVAFPAGVKWPGGAPTQPAAAAGEVATGLYIITRATPVAPFSYYGEFVGAFGTPMIGGSEADPGGPGSVGDDYGDPGESGGGSLLP